MFDCLAAYNNVCVTCMWSTLLSTCYPKLRGSFGDNSRKDVSGNNGKISGLLKYSLGSMGGKVTSNPDDLMDPNSRRMTVPRPLLKETE